MLKIQNSKLKIQNLKFKVQSHDLQFLAVLNSSSMFRLSSQPASLLKFMKPFVPMLRLLPLLVCFMVLLTSCGGAVTQAPVTMQASADGTKVWVYDGQGRRNSDKADILYCEKAESTEPQCQFVTPE